MRNRKIQVALPWSHVRSRQHAAREPLTNDITLRTVTVLWAKPLSVSRGVGSHRMRYETLMRTWPGWNATSWTHENIVSRGMNRVSVRTKSSYNNVKDRLSLRTFLAPSILFFLRIFFSKNREAHNYCTCILNHWKFLFTIN